jgi:sorbitol-specific phosphotransferase system component IIBC
MARTEMTRTEIGIFMVVVVLIVAWALLGPGGWVSGTIGAVIGIMVAAGLILNRRRARH